MIEEAKDLIDKKDYLKADGILYKDKKLSRTEYAHLADYFRSCFNKKPYHWKSRDARKIKDWDAARKHLDDFKTGFYQTRHREYSRHDRLDSKIQGGKSRERKRNSSLPRTWKKESKMISEILTEETQPNIPPDWKDQMALLDEMLMCAKVQFINGDLTGATETYRAVEAKFPENLEAKEMLKRISYMRQEESYLGYLKTRQEMLEEIEREWERPKVFDRQIEEAQEAKNEATELENKLKLIKIPGVPFFESPLDEVMQELQRPCCQAARFNRTGSCQKRGTNHCLKARR